MIIGEDNALANYFSAFNPCSQTNDIVYTNSISNKLEQNVFTYIAAYICHKIKDHGCEQCKGHLTENHNYEVRYNDIYLHQKDTEKKKVFEVS